MLIQGFKLVLLWLKAVSFTPLQRFTSPKRILRKWNIYGNRF